MSKLLQHSATLCTHCGEDCAADAVTLDSGEQFCCSGCKLVFELLRDNNLCSYYDFDAKAGNSFRFKTGVTRFEYLDHPDIVGRLIDFSQRGITSVTFYIPDIHCTSCLWLLEKLHKLNAGIIHSEVNFLRKEVSIRFNDAETSLRAVVELLAKIGYEPEIKLSNLDKPAANNRQHDLYLKLGLAGFAFGNTMMLSFPEYLSFGLSVDANLRWFFGILNIVLAIPVFVYSARDYFTNSWYSIRERAMSIDIPVALGLTALFVRSVADILTGAGSGFMDSFTGLVFFLLIGKLLQKKTVDTLSFNRDYKSYFPLSATVLRDGAELSVPISSIVVGDRMVVRNTEIIPADGILYSDNAWIDYSFVNGESIPVEILRGEQVYAGGRVSGAAVNIECTKECSQSYLTRLWNNEVFTKEKPSKLLEANNIFGKYFTIATLLLALVTAGYWLTINPVTALNAFTAVLIIACPCALTLAAPFALGWGLTMLGKSKFYLKNVSVVLDLASIDTVVFDKTGTLTQAQNNSISYTGTILTFDEQRLIQTCLRNSNHPFSRTIASEMPQQDGLKVDEFKEYAGLGVEARIEHRLVSAGSAAFITGRCASAPTPSPSAGGVYIAIDGEYKGCYSVENTYRHGLTRLFEKLKDNCTVYLLSGDNGREVTTLLPYFDDARMMRFSQSPEDKLMFIKTLRAEGKKTAMIGDGLNDAGALQQSTVGIAVTERSGSFSPACDGVLSAESIDLLPEILRFAKSTRNVIVYAFILSLVYNAVGLGFAVSGMLTPIVAAIFMPVSSLSVIGFTTGMVVWKARALRRKQA